jgi:RNA polymerase sigma-70 factor (ECF subfamily)
VSIFPETNEALIARVKDLGDETSWVEFVGLYQPAILRMAKRRGMQEADALDVIQQVFVSVAKSIESWSSISGGPPFRAWLATIARNAITNALTRQPWDAALGGSSVIEQLQSLPAHTALEATQSELLRETRHQLVLWAADEIRHEFGDEVWQSFWLTTIEGQPLSQVASTLNRSAGSMYVARFRVIARLKEKVQELSQSWDP